MSLYLDYEYATDAVLSGEGVSDTELHETLTTFRPFYSELQAGKRSKSLGFTTLPTQSEEVLTALERLAAEIREEVHDFIVIGIGGSDLGARAVHRALNHQFYNLQEEYRKGGPRIFFVGDTTDPRALQEVVDVVDFSSCAITVISKSGNTVEQMSSFLYLRKQLIESVGTEAAAKRLIMVTDSESGTLREMVTTYGYRSLSIPPEVGGRFSVLSAAGLFPLAVAGIDIRELLAGAAEMDNHDSQAGAILSLPFLYAAFQYLANRRGQHISVLMPYTYSLREVGFWFRQLWAESLGKRVNLDGEVVEVGPTPIASLGPTDQHSQMQLYIEGPVDKIVTFLQVKKTTLDLEVPTADENAIAYLGGHAFSEILESECISSAYALAQAGRPTLLLEVEELTAKSVGELLYFFELAVAYMGQFLTINAFDQPGVELGKNYMYGMLGRESYSEYTVPERSGHFSRNS